MLVSGSVGPFLNERTPSALNCFGDGCSLCHIMYLSSDYTRSNGEFGVPLHHPRFLEWVGTLESASLLKMGPGRWLHSLSREQAIDAARQLHRDMCLMTTNLDILDQYVNGVWEPGTFLPQRWLLGPWDPGPAGLQYKWRPWGYGALLWIQLFRVVHHSHFTGATLCAAPIKSYTFSTSYHVCNSMPKCPPTIRPWPPYNLFMFNMDFIYILTDGYHFVCSTNKTINYAF